MICSFKDSLLFLKSSLEENVRLAKEAAHRRGERLSLIEDHPLCMKNGFFKAERYNLLTEKGLDIIIKNLGSLHFFVRSLPYELISSFDSLGKMKSFPEYQKFHSKLKSKNVDYSTYQRTKEIYKEFECKNMLDLVKIYQMRWKNL